jgi:hypothetical protein
METLDNNSHYELNCGHRYCKQCISTWISEHVNCPYCNRQLTGTDFNFIQEESIKLGLVKQVYVYSYSADFLTFYDRELIRFSVYEKSILLGLFEYTRNPLIPQQIFQQITREMFKDTTIKSIFQQLMKPTRKCTMTYQPISELSTDNNDPHFVFNIF